MSPPCESYLRPTSSTSRRLLSAHVRVCSSACWCNCPPTCRPRTSSATTPTSRPTATPGSARRALRRARERLGPGRRVFVVEVASNDGYLLQHLVGAASARSASSRRRTSPRPPGPGASRPRCAFLGAESVPRWPRGTAGRPRGGQQRLRPRPGHRGLHARACAPWSPTTGTVSIEIPHLLRLIERNEYDTIYHEHYSYLSLLTTQRVLAAAGLTSSTSRSSPPTAARCGPGRAPASRAGEPVAGSGGGPGRGGGRRARTPSRVTRVRGTRRRSAQRPGQFLVGCSARASGSSPTAPRQGQHPAQPLRHPRGPVRVQRRPQSATSTAGSCPARTSRSARWRRSQARPDYVLIMPWNLRAEISAQLDYVREWGGRLVVALPELEIF